MKETTDLYLVLRYNRPRRKWRLCYLLFYLSVVTTLIIWHVFLLFLRKYPILERQISGCERENNEPSVTVPKSHYSWGGQKKWSGQAPLKRPIYDIKSLYLSSSNLFRWKHGAGVMLTNHNTLYLPQICGIHENERDFQAKWNGYGWSSYGLNQIFHPWISLFLYCHSSSIIICWRSIIFLHN